MGRKKMLKKLAEFFDMDARTRSKNQEDINELLSRLKIKEQEYKKELEQLSDPEEQKKLQQKIDIVHSQRKKGIAMLKELKEKDKN